jgi:hypothetical protein
VGSFLKRPVYAEIDKAEMKINKVRKKINWVLFCFFIVLG